MKKISGFIIAGMILLSVIAKIMVMSGTVKDVNETMAIILAFILMVAEVCALPAIIFYADRNKNNSLIPLAGYIGIGIYIIILIAYLLIAKAQPSSMEEYKIFYEKVKRYANYQELAKNLIISLEYVSIVNLLHFRTLNSKSQMMKVFAFLSAVVFFILSTIVIWKTEDNEKLQYAVEMTKNIYYLFLALFITLQALGDGELLAPATEAPLTNNVQNNTELPTSTNQETIFGNSTSGKPKFRNPALEEQEARLAAQKDAQEQMNNQQEMLIQSETQSTQMNPNMMPQQPIPMNQNMMPQQPIEQPQGMPVQGAPMNQPPIDPAMAQPPITNQQYPQ